MSVLLANAQLGVRRRADGGRDAHGAPVPTGWGGLLGPAPGYLNEQPDAQWVVGLDPSLWPVRQGDMVIDGESGGAWLVDTADLITHPVDSTVDWVRVTARQRGNGGTEPGGAWFVARYTDSAPLPEPTDSGGIWTGYGPPPADIPGAQPGDEYVDLSTGVIYVLSAG